MFPSISLEAEPWSSVRGLFMPLLNEISFDLISSSTNIVTYADASCILKKRFGKNTSQIAQELMHLR